MPRPALALAVALLAACAAPPAPSSTARSEADPTASLEAVPSDALGELTCDLPIVESASVPAVANITDVRSGEHAGYDRVVFEFAEGLPEITLDRATPPFTHDASGMPIQVDGSSFLRLTMRGGTKQMSDGTSSYDGSTDMHPGFETLVHLVEGGDFEAQSTWYLGLSAEACVRVVQLTDDGPPRLVIDLARPGA